VVLAKRLSSGYSGNSRRKVSEGRKERRERGGGSFTTKDELQGSTQKDEGVQDITESRVETGSAGLLPGIRNGEEKKLRLANGRSVPNGEQK